MQPSEEVPDREDASQAPAPLCLEVPHPKWRMVHVDDGSIQGGRYQLRIPEENGQAELDYN